MPLRADKPIIIFCLRFQFVMYCFISMQVCVAQKTIVRGVVIDKYTKDSVAFASIIFKNTTIGTTSNEFGRFEMETTKKADSIIVSYIGYKKQTLFIERNKTQLIEVFLEPDNYNLAEVTIKPKRNPAFRILDSVMEHRKQNDPTTHKVKEQEQYEKFEIFFANYSDRLTKRKQFKDFQFMFQQADSVGGKPKLPIYVSENIQQQFKIENPTINQSITIAEKATGESYEQLTSIANKLINEINIYQNFFIILDKSFVSPITNNYQLYYRYYLEDSLFIGNQRCFKIRFTPKFKQDLAFDGIMYVHDSTWAIKKINYSINNEINLNYVKDFFSQQEFTFAQNKWLLSKNETSAIVSPLKRKQSQEFMVHRKTSYKNFIFNTDSIAQHYQNLMLQKTQQPKKDATKKENSFWETARHDTLSLAEKNNYMIADTLNYVPIIKKIKKTAFTLATGYLDVGKISIGQLHTFYSFNPIERDRVKFGLRTNKRFSKKIQLEGYTAYGFNDQQIKYEASALYVFSKDKNRTTAGISYLNDLAQLGVSSNAIRFDNVITSLTRTSNFSKLTFNQEIKLFAERYWSKNISNKVLVTHTILNPLGDLSFETINNTNDTISTASTTNSEIAVNTRLSFNESFFTSEFSRRSLGSAFPIINFNMAFGLKGIANSQFNYQKIKLNLKGTLRLNPIGRSQYTIEAGKIFGKVPYSLLELHPGNQTLVYDELAFNLMNYFEFASNQYASLFFDHHFEGFILNKIPLIKKAKLREVFSARAVVGNLDKTNASFFLPIGMSDASKPYVECSVGLENIFKVVRIDYIWRATHLSANQLNNWSIKAKLYFSF